jgi:hypothetical protein
MAHLERPLITCYGGIENILDSASHSEAEFLGRAARVGPNYAAAASRREAIY